MSSDRIYAMPLGKVGNFVFDEKVVEVFPDMIQRSVPGYSSIVSMTTELAQQYSRPGGRIYDIGCSLGACTLPMAEVVPPSCEIEAIDSSQAMIERLRKIMSDWPADAAKVNLHLQDVMSVEFEPCCFAVLNFTLQFIPIEQRGELLSRVADSLCEGGALVLSEKVQFDSEGEQSLMVDLHHAFKRANGYSALEVTQKRSSLERTLLPETIETHRERLLKGGFRQFSCWFRCFNFVSMIAIK